MLRRSLAFRVVVDGLQRALPSQKCSPELKGRFGHGCVKNVSAAMIMRVHHGALRVDESLVFFLQKGRKPFVGSLWIGLRILYLLFMPLMDLLRMGKHQGGTRNLDVCFKCHYVARGDHSILNDIFGSNLLSKAGLTLCAASAVRAVSEHQSSVLV